MDWQKEDLKYIWHPCSQMKDYETLPPIIIEKGSGINLYDTNGKCYKDVISSWWCNLLGHCNSRINEAVKKQIDTLEHVIFANFTHKTVITLCQELMKVLPKGLCKFNFADNGSSSIEMALKMSFQYHYQTGNPQKKRFMALSDAYHGETLAALAMGGVDLYSELYKPILMDVIRIQAPDCFRCPWGKYRENCQCECFIKAEEQFEKYKEIESSMSNDALKVLAFAYKEINRNIKEEKQVVKYNKTVVTGRCVMYTMMFVMFFVATFVLYAVEKSVIGLVVMLGLDALFIPFMVLEFKKLKKYK
mgnify:CR=1 FL=1